VKGNCIGRREVEGIGDGENYIIMFDNGRIVRYIMRVIM
jgi:hypothetical protein